MVECVACHTMQHVQCYYLDKHGNLSSFKRHICVDCGPTPEIVELAIVRQMERKRHRSEYPGAVNSTEESQIAVKAGSWSLKERQILRFFIRQHGKNWHKISKNMRSRTWHEVYESLFKNRYTADICRAR